VIPTVVETAGVNAGDEDIGVIDAVAQLEGGQIPHHHGRLSAIEDQVREGEVDTAAQVKALYVKRQAADVLHFNVLEGIGVVGDSHGGVARIEHDLGDAQRWQRRVEGGGRWARPWTGNRRIVQSRQVVVVGVLRPRHDTRVLSQGDGTGVNGRAAGDAAAGAARVGAVQRVVDRGARLASHISDGEGKAIGDHSAGTAQDGLAEEVCVDEIQAIGVPGSYEDYF